MARASSGGRLVTGHLVDPKRTSAAALCDKKPLSLLAVLRYRDNCMTSG